MILRCLCDEGNVFANLEVWCRQISSMCQADDGKWQKEVQFSLSQMIRAGLVCCLVAYANSSLACVLGPETKVARNL